MVKMKRKTEEAIKNNEQEMQALRKENEEMKKKLTDGGPCAGPSNVVGRSYTSPPNLRSVEETRDKVPTHEMNGEILPQQVAQDDCHAGLGSPAPLYQCYY